MQVLSGCGPTGMTGEESMPTVPVTSQATDGVLAPMTAEALTSKLARLDLTTTMEDAITIFGGRPSMVVEADSDLWEYVSGNVVIRLWGINDTGGCLFHAVVATGGSEFSVSL